MLDGIRYVMTFQSTPRAFTRGDPGLNLRLRQRYLFFRFRESFPAKAFYPA